MNDIFKSYVEKFNNDDNEYFATDIANCDAESWMEVNIPHIEIPDKTIEEIYYFRWWTFRKHIRNTEDGYVVTEFLPHVPWAGVHNTIIAAAGFHVSEAKWLKCGRKIIEDYIKFWLTEKSITYLYSSWILYSVFEYCTHINDYSFGVDNLELMMQYYKKTEAEHMTECGLLWSYDGNDAMEFSISGNVSDDVFGCAKGVRPTLNSYMAANAYALSVFADKAGDMELSAEYFDKYVSIKEKLTKYLWDGTFYKANHNGRFSSPSADNIPQLQNVRELIGYIPWCFNLAPVGFESAFSELKNDDGFNGKFGLTTAERRHPRYLYETNHECMWNGYVWPFATSQTLTAMKNLLNNYDQNFIDKTDFYNVLFKYSDNHYRVTDDGRKICWIDEVIHPETGEWSSRETLAEWGWKEEKGGFERGKDYNHSSFCDIVLGGLLGIKSENGKLIVSPQIPDKWEYFCVDNLCIGEKIYRIVYDKNGDKYSVGKGLFVFEE